MVARDAMFQLCDEIKSLEGFNPEGYSIQLKVDGSRIMVEKKGDQIKITNRRGFRKERYYPELVEKLKTIKQNFTIDGEVVVLDKEGKSDFTALLSRENCKDMGKIRLLTKFLPATAYFFDVVEYEGRDLRNAPLKERMEVMGFLPTELLIPSFEDLQIAKDYVDSRGEEGLIFKRESSVYAGKRVPEWIKWKTRKDMEVCFVKYETNNKGITLESADGIRVQCAGEKSNTVKMAIDTYGVVRCRVSYLRMTADRKLFQPAFMGSV